MSSPVVVIVGANKGGVGKTTVCRALLDYFKANSIDTRAFDTETPNGNLKRYYPNTVKIVDITKSDDQMVVFDDLTRAAVTVLDMQAAKTSETVTLLTDTGLMEMAEAGKIKIVMLHVIGSTVASFEEIAPMAAALKGATHFIVANHIFNEAFFEGIASTASFGVAAGVIDIPQLDPRAAEHVDAAGLPFSDFITSDKHSLMMRGKVRHWLKQVYAAFDLVKLKAQ